MCSSTCTDTEAPNELKANIDKPYIDCNGATGTHFKYRISNPEDNTFTPVESSIFLVSGTERILHQSTLPTSATDYVVECIYGDSTLSVPVVDTECVKSVTVRTSTANNEVQGCAGITNNYENFVGYEKWVHNTGFNASIGCVARKSDPEVLEPFLVQYGTEFTPLGYLNSLVDIGRFTSELDVHTFESSLSTPTTCAVRVGDGYSTNSLCQNLGCGGPECDMPYAYTIQPSTDNLYCTREEYAEYIIGCASGDGYAACIRTDIPGNLYYGLDENFDRNLTFRFDDETGQSVVMDCTSATPQTAENTTPTCTMSLPTDRELAILASVDPVEQYQVIYDPVPRDIENPTASIAGVVGGVTLSSTNSKVLTSSEWLNKPVTATIRCTNTDPENNDSCTCAWLVKADVSGQNDNTDWGLISPLKDIVDYQRIIRNETLQNQEFFVFDNVGNMDPDKSKVSITL